MGGDLAHDLDPHHELLRLVRLSSHNGFVHALFFLDPCELTFYSGIPYINLVSTVVIIAAGALIHWGALYLAARYPSVQRLLMQDSDDVDAALPPSLPLLGDLGGYWTSQRLMVFGAVCVVVFLFTAF